MQVVVFSLVCFFAIISDSYGFPWNINKYQVDLAMENHNLFQGDIILDKKIRNGRRNKYYLWPNKTIPYAFDIILGYKKYRNEIMYAMDHISNQTCIRFKPRTNEKNYVKFINGNGCYSHVGLVHRGEQKISLGYGCHTLGTRVHEIMHAIGFFHHHERPDRDDYIKIHWDNLDKDFYDDFEKLTHERAVMFTPFDFNSIMLYGPRDFSKDHFSVVMSPKIPGVTLRKVSVKPGLSKFDAYSINKLYECI